MSSPGYDPGDPISLINPIATYQPGDPLTGAVRPPKKATPKVPSMFEQLQAEYATSGQMNGGPLGKALASTFGPASQVPAEPSQGVSLKTAIRQTTAGMTPEELKAWKRAHWVALLQHEAATAPQGSVAYRAAQSAMQNPSIKLADLVFLGAPSMILQAYAMFSPEATTEEIKSLGKNIVLQGGLTAATIGLAGGAGIAGRGLARSAETDLARLETLDLRAPVPKATPGVPEAAPEVKTPVRGGQAGKTGVPEVPTGVARPGEEQFQKTALFKKDTGSISKSSITDGVPEAPGATGLANQVQAREAEAGILGQVAATAGKSPEQWQAIGKQEFGEGYDFEALAQRIAGGEEELTGAKVGILLEGKRHLVNDLNNAAERMKASPENKTLRSAYDQAKDRLQSFVENVQAGKGRWSDVGRALQAGATLDEGNFAQVLEEARRIGPEPSAKWQTHIQGLSEQIAAKDKRIAELQAQAKTAAVESEITTTVKRTARFSVEALDKELDALLKRGQELLAGTVQASLGVPNPELLVIAGRIGWNYAKRGINTLDEIVGKVVEHFPQLERQQVIDAMAPQTGRTQSQIEKQIASLRAQAKRESTTGKTSLQEKIADLQDQLDTGEFHVVTKRETQISTELADLRAERDIWASRVRGALRSHEQGAAKEMLQGLAQGVRGTILGSDVGVVTRQGLFSISRPVSFAKGLAAGAKSLFSEKSLAKIERGLDERIVAGRKAVVIEKKAGLQRTRYFEGFNQQEELSLARLGELVPELGARGLEKIGLGRAGGVVRKAGQTFGGSLGRAQHAFLNTVRADTFDRAVSLGYNDSELAIRARFINNATGRGNFKNIPTLLQTIMTSPRYETSRWAMLAEPLRNPARIVADLAKGRGLNRGAVANLQDMAVTAAEVYGLYKLAELAGYKTNFDPLSADFLKLRRGNETWDPTAGMAPRLRDAFRVVAFWASPDYGKTVTDVVGRATVRTISPAVRTPLEQGSMAYQRSVLHRPERKVESPFSGFGLNEGDLQGWITFAPLIGQTFWQTLQQENPQAAAGAALKEFLGQNVNRYPPPKHKQ